MLKALLEQNRIISGASRNTALFKRQADYDEFMETIKEIDPEAKVVGASSGYFVTIYFSDGNKAKKILKKLNSQGYDAELNLSNTAIVVQP